MWERRNEMKSTITFFPVDNGDMTLIKLSVEIAILIDINDSESAEDGRKLGKLG